jgi:hypothetical protein
MPTSSSNRSRLSRKSKPPPALIREPKTNTTPLYLFAIGTLTEGSLGRWQTALTSHFKNLQSPGPFAHSPVSSLVRPALLPYRSFAVGPALTPSLKWSKTALVSAKPKLCLVFAGQGPQHIFMGRQLSEAFPAFLDAIKANDEILVNKYGQPSFVERSGLFIPESKPLSPPTVFGLSLMSFVPSCSSKSPSPISSSPRNQVRLRYRSLHR